MKQIELIQSKYFPQKLFFFERQTYWAKYQPAQNQHKLKMSRLKIKNKPNPRDLNVIRVLIELNKPFIKSNKNLKTMDNGHILCPPPSSSYRNSLQLEGYRNFIISPFDIWKLFGQNFSLTVKSFIPMIIAHASSKSC